MDVIRPTHK